MNKRFFLKCILPNLVAGLIFFGCWNYKLNEYAVLSNYKAHTPLVIDLNTGKKYSFKSSLLKRKEYPFFVMIIIHPEMDRMVLVWSKIKYNNRDSLVEVRSIKNDSLIKKHIFKKPLVWADLYNNKIYFSTDDTLEIMEKRSNRQIYKSEGIFYKVNIFRNYLFAVESEFSKDNLICIDLKNQKKVFTINDVFYFERYKDKIFYIKREPDRSNGVFRPDNRVIYSLDINSLRSKIIKKTIDMAESENDMCYIHLGKNLSFQSTRYHNNWCITMFDIISLPSKNGSKIEYIAINKVKKKLYSFGKIRRIEAGPLKVQFIPRIKGLKKYFSHF